MVFLQTYTKTAYIAPFGIKNRKIFSAGTCILADLMQFTVDEIGDALHSRHACKQTVSFLQKRGLSLSDSGNITYKVPVPYALIS